METWTCWCFLVQDNVSLEHARLHGPVSDAIKASISYFLLSFHIFWGALFISVRNSFYSLICPSTVPGKSKEWLSPRDINACDVLREGCWYLEECEKRAPKYSVVGNPGRHPHPANPRRARREQNGCCDHVGLFTVLPRAGTVNGAWDLWRLHVLCQKIGVVGLISWFSKWGKNVNFGKYWVYCSSSPQFWKRLFGRDLWAPFKRR